MKIRDKAMLYAAFLLMVIVFSAVICSGQGNPPSAPPADAKTLPLDVQVQILKWQVSQRETRLVVDSLQQQENAAAQAFNQLNDQIDKAEHDAIVKMGMDPASVQVDDGRTEAMRGQQSQKTFAVTPKPEPAKPVPAPEARKPEKK
jgi:hypothetical protein